MVPTEGQGSWRGSQVVRQRSAKPLFGGSIPPRASNLSSIFNPANDLAERKSSRPIQKRSAKIALNPARICANFARHSGQVVTSACGRSKSERRTGTVAPIRDSGAADHRVRTAAECAAAISSADGFDSSIGYRELDRAIQFRHSFRRLASS
jgi:hypothetical protein